MCYFTPLPIYKLDKLKQCNAAPHKISLLHPHSLCICSTNTKSRESLRASNKSKLLCTRFYLGVLKLCLNNYHAFNFLTSVSAILFPMSIRAQCQHETRGVMLNCEMMLQMQMRKQMQVSTQQYSGDSCAATRECVWK